METSDTLWTLSVQSVLTVRTIQIYRACALVQNSDTENCTTCCFIEVLPGFSIVTVLRLYSSFYTRCQSHHYTFNANFAVDIPGAERSLKAADSAQWRSRDLLGRLVIIPEASTPLDRAESNSKSLQGAASASRQISSTFPR